MNKFTIENEYQAYLKLVNLYPESKMPLEQRTETRRAFYGAAGRLLVLFRDEIAALPEDEGLKAIKDLWDECLLFWHSSKDRKN